MRTTWNIRVLKLRRSDRVQESQKDHTAQRFVGVVESIDDRLKKSTVGLVTLSDFQKTRAGLEEEQRQVAAQSTKRWVSLEV